MSRRVKLVLLYEDQQHSAFMKRFFEELGWSSRELRFVLTPSGKGSAVQFVRDNFPKELTAYRSRRNHVESRLVVMIDGDHLGVQGRIKMLNDACADHSVALRTENDGVAIFVPTWRIETWLAYLDGETVEENRRDYPRLSKPSLCKPHAKALADMCRCQSLPSSAPPSLVKSCEEFRRL